MVSTRHPSLATGTIAVAVQQALADFGGWNFHRQQVRSKAWSGLLTMAADL
jgi:hypothetical protein